MYCYQSIHSVSIRLDPNGMRFKMGSMQKIALHAAPAKGTPGGFLTDESTGLALRPDLTCGLREGNSALLQFNFQCYQGCAVQWKPGDVLTHLEDRNHVGSSYIEKTLVRSASSSRYRRSAVNALRQRLEEQKREQKTETVLTYVPRGQYILAYHMDAAACPSLLPVPADEVESICHCSSGYCETVFIECSKDDKGRGGWHSIGNSAKPVVVLEDVRGEESETGVLAGSERSSDQKILVGGVVMVLLMTFCVVRLSLRGEHYKQEMDPATGLSVARLDADGNYIPVMGPDGWEMRQIHPVTRKVVPDSCGQLLDDNWAPGGMVSQGYYDANGMWQYSDSNDADPFQTTR